MKPMCCTPQHQKMSSTILRPHREYLTLVGRWVSHICGEEICWQPKLSTSGPYRLLQSLHFEAWVRDPVPISKLLSCLALALLSARLAACFCKAKIHADQAAHRFSSDIQFQLPHEPYHIRQASVHLQQMIYPYIRLVSLRPATTSP